MREAKIEYKVPGPSRLLGDTELILNAMGSFEYDQSFPHSHEYHVEPLETKDNAVSIQLKRVRQDHMPQTTIYEDQEAMRRGVEAHFPKADRERLQRHLVTIVLKSNSEPLTYDRIMRIIDNKK